MHTTGPGLLKGNKINKLREKMFLTLLYVVYIVHTMSFIRRIKRGDTIYLAEVENKRIGNKIVQKHIRYVGKQVDDRQLLTGSVERSSVEKVTVYGPLLVLHEIAMQLDLGTILGEYGQYLLSLAYAHCVSPDSLNGIVEWYRKTEIANILDIPEVSYEKLVEAIDSLEGLNGEDIQERIFQRMKEVLT